MVSSVGGPRGAEPKLTLPHGDPVAVELASAIHRGDLDTLRRLLGECPGLASARMIGRKGIEGGWRSPLHAACDWPGYFPAAPVAVAVLLPAGADPNDGGGGDRPETPLHWAASSDDVDVAVVLIDGGADLETPGGSIGTQLDNAIGYSCWHVARLLVARGANVDKLWHAAALGMVERMEQLLELPDAAGEVSQAFWHACAGGQRRAAEYLLAQGADINWTPDYAEGTPLDAASSLDTRRANVVGWLQELARRCVGTTAGLTSRRRVAKHQRPSETPEILGPARGRDRHHAAGSEATDARISGRSKSPGQWPPVELLLATSAPAAAGRADRTVDPAPMSARSKNCSWDDVMHRGIGRAPRAALTRDYANQNCSIARALEAVGERWTRSSSVSC